LAADSRVGARETTGAPRRRLYVLVMFIALGELGSIFIALHLFPDPATGISGESDGAPLHLRCSSDNLPDRLRGTTPLPVVWV
jgi:hypothetical protein